VTTSRTADSYCSGISSRVRATLRPRRRSSPRSR
jgi:hypothetical protein